MTIRTIRRLVDFVCDFCGTEELNVRELDNKLTLPKGWDSTPRIFYAYNVTHIPWEHACESCQYEIKTLLRKLKEGKTIK